MAAALIVIGAAVLGTAALVSLILDELDDFTGDIALDQTFDGEGIVEAFA